MLSSSPAVLLRARSAVVGISPGANQHELLATLRSQGVSLFDARTQTSLRTWPCRAGVQLTGAAVLHPASGRMVGVRDHSVLFSWHRDGAIDFDVTQNVGGPVLTMLHDPSLLDGILVVRGDGSAVVYDVTLTRQLGSLPRPPSTTTSGRAKGGRAASARAVWASLLPLPGSQESGAPIALAVLMEEEEERLHLHVASPR